MDHKIEQALMRIREFCPPEGYYVAFSGGKDSIVVLDLVRKAGVLHDAHMNMAGGLDPCEVIKFVKKYYPEVQRIAPRTSFWKMVEKARILPQMNIRYCCRMLKEQSGTGRIVLTGIRWAESNKRAKRRMVEVCRDDTTKRFVHPIIDWSSGEVWEYIKSNNLPYPSLYDEGFHRIGCIGCPNGNRKRDFKRWPKVKERFMKVADKCKMTPRNPTGIEYFQWWMDNKNHGKPNEAQCVLFE
jgi:phosphoadenosine phosphosulfate reductase